MCGICGYIGKDCAKEILISSLKMLEYRGYDSAGIAFFDNKQIVTKKCLGNIEKLEKKMEGVKEFYGGIGHTRWATNGKVI